MLTVSEALDQYFFEHIKLKAAAPLRAEQAIHPLKRHLSKKTLCTVDIPTCREYAKLRRIEGVGDSTIRRELGTLQAAANHARRWRRLTLDRMPSIELTSESAPKTLWLMKSELETLLEAAGVADRRVFRFVQLAYHTAARKRAIEALRWDQVDENKRRIDLRHATDPQTKKRKPIVPISQPMAEELSAMRLKAVTPYVLMTDADIRPAFDRVAKVAGLATLEKDGLRSAGTLTPHVLRHSRATHLLEAGKSPWAVASLLGDTLPTLLRVYGHACPNYLEEALA